MVTTMAMAGLIIVEHVNLNTGENRAVAENAIFVWQHNSATAIIPERLFRLGAITRKCLGQK